MAKTKGPLLSLDAHGSFGRVLTYSHRKSGRQVRKYTKPLVAASAKQRGQRRLTEFLVAQWQNMSAGDKATWETNARLSGPNITGYHYFLREAQRNLYLHTGLCGYWHCNEIVGGKVLDLSGNALHGSLEPGYPANAPVLVDSYKTKFSKALLFDGVDEYVVFGDQAKLNFGLGDFTIMFWLYLDGDQDQKRFISKEDWIATFKGYAVYVTTGPKMSFVLGTGTETNYLTNIPFAANKWVWIVAQRYGSNSELFIDNDSKQINVEADLNVDVAQPFFLGSTRWIGNHPKCILDEVCIYNRKLEVAELTTRYNFALRKVD